jgi:tetratricopeptide (TPR) repeat protein
MNLGACKKESKQFREALELYDKAIAKDNTNPKAYLRKGNLYTAMGEYQAA